MDQDQMPDEITAAVWFEQIGAARQRLVETNTEHHRAREEFDQALDRYIVTRDNWSAARDRLDALEEFEPGPIDSRVMVRRSGGSVP